MAQMRCCSAWLAALAAIAWASVAAAQDDPTVDAAEGNTPTAARAPEARPSSPVQCYPRCRAGYLCHQGQCISECNPPCPSDQICVAGQRCELASTEAVLPGSSSVHEPPPPPAPERKGFAERNHSMLAFHMGLGGDVETGGTTTDLDTTLGVNVRADIPVVKYLLLGPMFQFAAWRANPDGFEPDRDFMGDVDFYLRGRLPLEADSVGFQLWGGVPVGVSFSFLGQHTGAGLDGFGLGWNIGVLVGGAIHFTRDFGMFAEVGWVQHKMSHDYAAGNRTAHFKLSQTNLNLGFVFGDS